MPQAMYGIRYIRILVGQPPPSVLHGVAVPLHRTIRRVPLPGGAMNSVYNSLDKPHRIVVQCNMVNTEAYP